MRLLVPALLLLAAPLAGLAATASPCAAPCGSLVASCEGTYDTFTAEGVSTASSTFWELRIAEHYAGGGVHAPTREQTGTTATLFHSAGPYFWGAPEWSEAWFYADGDLLAYAKCP